MRFRALSFILLTIAMQSFAADSDRPSSPNGSRDSFSYEDSFKNLEARFLEMQNSNRTDVCTTALVAAPASKRLTVLPPARSDESPNEVEVSIQSVPPIFIQHTGEITEVTMSRPRRADSELATPKPPRRSDSDRITNAPSTPKPPAGQRAALEANRLALAAARRQPTPGVSGFFKTGRLLGRNHRFTFIDVNFKPFTTPELDLITALFMHDITLGKRFDRGGTQIVYTAQKYMGGIASEELVVKVIGEETFPRRIDENGNIETYEEWIRRVSQVIQRQNFYRETGIAAAENWARLSFDKAARDEVRETLNVLLAQQGKDPLPASWLPSPTLSIEVLEDKIEGQLEERGVTVFKRKRFEKNRALEKNTDQIRLLDRAEELFQQRDREQSLRDYDLFEMILQHDVKTILDSVIATEKFPATFMQINGSEELLPVYADIHRRNNALVEFTDDQEIIYIFDL